MLMLCEVFKSRKPLQATLTRNHGMIPGTCIRNLSGLPLSIRTRPFIARVGLVQVKGPAEGARERNH